MYLKHIHKFWSALLGFQSSGPDIYSPLNVASTNVTECGCLNVASSIKTSSQRITKICPILTSCILCETLISSQLIDPREPENQVIEIETTKQETVEHGESGKLLRIKELSKQVDSRITYSANQCQCFFPDFQRPALYQTLQVVIHHR